MMKTRNGRRAKAQQVEIWPQLAQDEAVAASAHALHRSIWQHSAQWHGAGKAVRCNAQLV